MKIPPGPMFRAGPHSSSDRAENQILLRYPMITSWKRRESSSTRGTTRKSSRLRIQNMHSFRKAEMNASWSCDLHSKPQQLWILYSEVLQQIPTLSQIVGSARHFDCQNLATGVLGKNCKVNAGSYWNFPSPLLALLTRKSRKVKRVILHNDGVLSGDSSRSR